eukprot:CAMPEP_0118950408 /NCGR_PEP_ID=MMETSP1169-20130426/51318_1 /TAXON_ID=36882 /ORGANISM="Pyramimonas obovata, Strain CCMP722" /LENGTH=66 /DNA_ID=CAMNT_0006897237 /DNA_START=31 /DNA_END=227 /DNA_ORIENTATION=-
MGFAKSAGSEIHGRGVTIPKDATKAKGGYKPNPPPKRSSRPVRASGEIEQEFTVEISEQSLLAKGA